MAFAEVAGLLPDQNLATLLRHPQLLAGKSVMELGPGDSLLTALVAKAAGSERTWLVDGGDFAARTMAPYVSMTKFLHANGFETPWQDALSSFESMTYACNFNYLTDGMESIKRIPSGSVHFCFSNAVLEHIPRCEFEEFVSELSRVLAPEGIAVHRIDLTDHLGGSLNNLRFSDSVWESDFFRRSGFYTNRLRFSEVTKAFQKSGRAISLPRIVKWDVLPIARSSMSKEFQLFDDGDLCVIGFDVIVRGYHGGSVPTSPMVN
jgi:SAM-dependent methyltransferase